MGKRPLECLHSSPFRNRSLAETPLINGYAALFLVGGAVFSSRRFAREGTMLHRAVGNALIAIGAIMPGIGGIVAKTGTIETLYITETTASRHGDRDLRA